MLDIHGDDKSEMVMPERVVILNDLSVLRGGATSVALSSALELSKAGIPVTFISGDDGSEIAPEHDQVEFLPLAGKHILDSSRVQAMVNGIFNVKAYRLVSGWIARNDTPRTIYHVHGWSKILSPAIFLALKPVAGRLVVHAHDFFVACPNGGFFDFRKGEPCERKPLSFSCLSCHCDRRSYAQKIWRTARFTTFRLFFSAMRKSLVTPVHDNMVPLLIKGGIKEKQTHVLRNPIHPWRKKRVRAEQNHHFLYVGRLDEDKGVLLLARAAQQANIPLRMVGVGPFAVQIKRDYPETELAGWKNREQLQELVGDVRVLVMPTRCRETFGLAVFEALMSGIPVIISDRSMASEEIHADAIGLAGNPENTEQFAELLRKMATDNQLVEQASRKAYRKRKQLAPDAVAYTDLLLQTYHKRLSDQLPSPKSRDRNETVTNKARI